MTATTLTNIDTALGAFLDVAPQMETAWEHLTCRETDVFAALALAAGSPDVAATIVAMHAPDDEADDLHVGVRFEWVGDEDSEPSGERATYEELIVAAREYVATLA